MERDNQRIDRNGANLNNFEKLNEWIRNTESSIVNVVSSIAPWLAPIPPAFMTYQHARGVLDFPEWIATLSAVTVEILGFSTVSTFLAFWFHNRKNHAEVKKAPVNLIIFAFIFYLSLIIVSNVLLDTFDNAKWAVITVRGLFTLQSIPAALIVAVRTQHRDLIANIEKERANKANQPRTSRANDEPDANGSRTFAGLSQSEKYSLAQMETSEAAKFWNVTTRAIQKWKIRVNEEISQGKL